MTERKLIPVRTSERVCFKECRAKWWWAYVKHLEVKRQRKALEFGTLVHAALASRYRPGTKRGPHPARTFANLYDKAIESGSMEPLIFKGEDEYDPQKIDGRELGIAMLNGFVDLYGTDDRYRVIKPELSFQIDIHEPRTGAYLFTYVSTTDVLVEDLKYHHLGYLEWKTSSNLEPFGAPLTLDEQANSYWTFGTLWLQEKGYLKPGQDATFMEYTFLRKALPDNRPKNAEGKALNKPGKTALVDWCAEHCPDVNIKGATIPVLSQIVRDHGGEPELLGEVSSRQPQPLFRRERVMRGEEERRQTFLRAVEEAREMQMVRRGELKVYKNPGRHCLWCEFRDMCEVHETGSDWRAIRDNMFRKWSPYEDHMANLTAVELVKESING